MSRIQGRRGGRKNSRESPNSFDALDNYIYIVEPSGNRYDVPGRVLSVTDSLIDPMNRIMRSVMGDKGYN